MASSIRPGLTGVFRGALGRSYATSKGRARAQRALKILQPPSSNIAKASAALDRKLAWFGRPKPPRVRRVRRPRQQPPTKGAGNRSTPSPAKSAAAAGHAVEQGAESVRGGPRSNLVRFAEGDAVHEITPTGRGKSVARAREQQRSRRLDLKALQQWQLGVSHATTDAIVEEPEPEPPEEPDSLNAEEGSEEEEDDGQLPLCSLIAAFQGPGADLAFEHARQQQWPPAGVRVVACTKLPAVPMAEGTCCLVDDETQSSASSGSL